MTPTQRKAMEQALEALEWIITGRGKDTIEAAHAALRAALAEQQDVQEVPQHLADDERVAALCDLSYVAGMKAGWNFCVSDDSDGLERCQNSVGEAIRILKAHRAAPTPPAQQAVQIENEDLKARIARSGVEQQRAVLAEREACARVCDERAMKNEHACEGLDDEDATSLRSAAWQMSVCAAAIRARGAAPQQEGETA